MNSNVTTTRVEDLKLNQSVITEIDISAIQPDYSQLGINLIDFLGNISFIRPKSEEEIVNMNINIDIYDNPECSTPLNGNTSISNKNPTEKKYFSCFSTNNAQKKWIDGDDDTLSNGFGEELSNRPIVFNIGDWLKEVAKITEFKKLYIIYSWENASTGQKSDLNSVIWPNFENY